jgi:hypothetical protein
MGALLCPAGVNYSDAECVHLPTDNYLPHLVTHIVCTKRLASGELAVHGYQWPMLVYTNQEYDEDEPWEGLFRNQLLVWVKISSFLFILLTHTMQCRLLNTYSHPLVW